MEALLAGADPHVLSSPLLAEIERHGFLDAPRPLGPSLPTVQLQLTNACNLVCAYCCTHSGGPRAREIDFEQASALVRAIPSAMGPDARVALLGGEPLLVPWAVALADLILDLGLELTIFSNGVPLADATLAAEVARLLGRGALLRVSLASASSGVCDALSGRARFEAAVAGLHALAAHGGLPRVDLMLAPQNVADLEASLPGLRRALPPGVRISVGLLYRGGRETGEHLFGSRRELEAALDRVAFGAGERIDAPVPTPLAHRRHGCACALGRHLHVRSDGTLFSCFRMEDPVGRLDVEGFERTAEALRENPRPSILLAACRDCPLVTLCGGGCRSDNLLHRGDPELPACGPWRVRVLCEMLAEDRPDAVEWPALHLLDEARRRGIPCPDDLPLARPSLHLLEP